MKKIALLCFTLSVLACNNTEQKKEIHIEEVTSEIEDISAEVTLNKMIDTKSNILISINALILSLILGTVMNQLGTDPHLIYPVIMMLFTNLTSIAYAVFATRPELFHGNAEVKNLMFYGNFYDMKESEYVKNITDLMNEGDELYKTIAKDTYYLGKTIDRKFKLIRKSFNIFLIGIILSVLAFIACHALFGGLV